MSTFKTSLKVVAAHRLYILIYLVALSLLGLLAGATQAGSSSDQVKQATASVAVIDRDGSTISRGVRDYVESVGEARPLEDSRQAIQDATAQNRINYILIIPAGYGQRLQEAIRQGTEPPRMDTVIGYESAAGSLMNVRTDSYLGQVADYLSTLTDDPARAVSLARDTMNHSAPAERVAQDATPLPYGLTVYAKFSIYPIMAFAIVTISTLMASLGRRAVRSRLTAAPVSSRSRNLGVMGACLVIGLIGWLWIFGLAGAAAGGRRSGPGCLHACGGLARIPHGPVRPGPERGQCGSQHRRHGAVLPGRDLGLHRVDARCRRPSRQAHARLLGDPGDLGSVHRHLDVRRRHRPPARQLRDLCPVRRRDLRCRHGRGPHPGAVIAVRRPPWPTARPGRHPPSLPGTHGRRQANGTTRTPSSRRYAVAPAVTTARKDGSPMRFASTRSRSSLR